MFYEAFIEVATLLKSSAFALLVVEFVLFDDCGSLQPTMAVLFIVKVSLANIN